MESKPVFDFAIKVNALENRYRYSICTLMTNAAEYQEMVQSFINAGFSTGDCEYRYIDNSAGNSFDAYYGINLFLQQAQGEYLIICHQDVLLNYDNRAVLEQRIAEITQLDPDWAILSNAGGIEGDLYRRYVANVFYEDGFHQQVGTTPQKVDSVDENFIVVKRSANLALSHDLNGFHLYGTDLCLVAELLGFSAYVVEFKLLHKSYGNPNEDYQQILSRLITKYRYFFRSRRILTTLSDFYLSASSLQNQLAETKFAKKVVRKIKKISKLQHTESGIKVFGDTNIYILCPAGYATGGPECMHQLGYTMRRLGYQAYMYYYRPADSTAEGPHPNYDHYQVPIARDIPNHRSNLVIIPETYFAPFFDPALNKVRKVMWWLSVDNYFVVLNELLDRKKRKPVYIFKSALGMYRIADIPFLKRSEVYHIVQSAYAADFLRKNDLPVAGVISDYLGDTFLANADASPAGRIDQVLYNPKKGVDFTQRLIDQSPHLKWLPLVNYTPQQVAEILLQSKVYIDFGEHPGKDRFPREAAVMGCCVITGLKGSAAFKNDVNIPDEFKFDEQTTPFSEIIAKIETCFNDFKSQSAKFDSYRSLIKTEQAQLSDNIIKVFKR